MIADIYKNHKKYVYDVELYPNYFCIVFKELGKSVIFVVDSQNIFQEKEKFKSLLDSSMFISYGGHGFDDKVLEYFWNSLQSPKKISTFCIHKDLKKIYHNVKSDKKKSHIYSLDLLFEYNSLVGIKGFSFNLGDSIVEHVANFKYPLPKSKIEVVIDYCINDVLKTEQLYEYFMKNSNFWEERIELLSKILTPEKILSWKELSSYFRYRNIDLLALLLKKDFSEDEKCLEQKVKQKNKFEELKSITNNRGLRTCYLLHLKEDYVYELLRPISKKLSGLSFDCFEQDLQQYKTKLMDLLCSPKSPVYSVENQKYVQQVHNIFLEKINKVAIAYEWKLLKVFRNALLFEASNHQTLQEEIWKNYPYFEEMEKVSKVIRLNRYPQSSYVLSHKQEYRTGLFEKGLSVNPSRHAWLGECLRLYYTKKLSLKKCIATLFQEEPELLFMYFNARSQVLCCDEEGNLLEEKMLSVGKHYRVYFSKTGTFKAIDLRKHSSSKYKWYSNFGFGSFQSSYFKLKLFEEEVEKFDCWEDVDLESYELFAKHYIQKTR